MYKELLVLLIFVAVSTAIVCRPNSCDTVRCAQRECTKDEVLKKGGFCNCCLVCIKILKEGERCGPHPRGEPPTSECGEGLECSPSTYTCECTDDSTSSSSEEE